MIHSTPRVVHIDIEAPIPMTPITVANVMPQAEPGGTISEETDKRRKQRMFPLR